LGFFTGVGSLQYKFFIHPARIPMKTLIAAVIAGLFATVAVT
jgi:hypothetical protein